MKIEECCHDLFQGIDPAQHTFGNITKAISTSETGVFTKRTQR
jgi:hypothetical protein